LAAAWPKAGEEQLMTRPNLTPGLEIDGFRLLEQLPSGGMGSIWRAMHPDLPYPIILKVPFFDPGEDVSTIIGYEVEEMILKRLNGPHVPRFSGSGALDATPYIAMELVAGETLQREVGRAPLPWQAAADIGARIAEALDDLHHQKVVHLDLKPGNVIMSGQGAVLIDFGLARHENLPDLFGEETGKPLGTPAYIAPEQILGDRTQPASDIYALGCILYELVTGGKPFGEPTTRAGMERRLYHAPIPPRTISRSIPQWLQEVILRCMEVDPARRYASAGQLLFDLRNPEQVVLTERSRKEGVRDTLWQRLSGLFRRRRAKTPPFQPSIASRLSGAAVVLAAVDLSVEPNERLLDEIRTHVARVLTAEQDARLACLCVIKTKLAGEDATHDASGRPIYINRLVLLKDWARPLGLSEEKISYHVVEALDVAAAILKYAGHNRVDHIVMGARASSALRRHLGSVSAQVAAEAECAVTVVRVKRAASSLLAAELPETG